MAVMLIHQSPLTFFSSNHTLHRRYYSCCFSFFKPSPASLFSIGTISSTLTLEDSNFTYGPSLKNGQKPSHQQPCHFSEESEFEIDKQSFTRVFDISAIRVPSQDCFALENRLRGHLLNWPRIRNIARVPGDEIEDDFKKILPKKIMDDEKLDSITRRIYGRAEGDGFDPVLYREKLVKAFNCRGFVRFRNLAKISRPKKKKKMVDEGLSDEGKRMGKNSSVTVEVVDEDGGDDEDLRGLLGDDFKAGGKWRGSTRLLLLDERYADKGVEELPEAIKAVLNGDIGQSRPTVLELVRCQLTLFYDYWQMNEILEALLPKSMVVPTSFEIVGHIAHLNLSEEHLPYKRLIAKVVLDKNRPKIQTVVNKIDSIQNTYRTMQLEVLAGNHSLVTTVIENGIRFHVDLAAVYWNSRLATERQRLINIFSSNDVVCDVFSGVGPIAISAAKKVKHVYANDLNPSAVEYLERNIVLNKLDRKIEVYNMDGRRFIDAIFASQRAQAITQVVMNLPNDAAEYLDAFRGILRRNSKAVELSLPKIHVYGFSKAQDPEFDFIERIRTALCDTAVDAEIQRVRLVAPGKWMLCASFVLPRDVALAKREPSGHVNW